MPRPTSWLPSPGPTPADFRSHARGGAEVTVTGLCGAQFVEDGGEFVESLTRVASQASGEALPVFGGGRLPRGQGRECFADFLNGKPYALGGPDHRYPAQDVGVEPALVAGGALAGQQAVIGVPAHR